MVGPRTQGVAHDDGIDPAFLGSSRNRQSVWPRTNYQQRRRIHDSISIGSVTRLHMFGQMHHVGGSRTSVVQGHNVPFRRNRVGGCHQGLGLLDAFRCEKLHDHGFHECHAFSPSSPLSPTRLASTVV